MFTIQNKGGLKLQNKTITILKPCVSLSEHQGPRMQWNLALTRTLNADTLKPNTLLQPYFVEEAPFRNLLKLNNDMS